jgi:hypothetical protein
VYEPATVPSRLTKNEVGMYLNENCSASRSAEGSPVMAFTKATLSPYAGTTLSATAEISMHDCQVREWNST